MSKHEIGDLVPISGIVKITGIQRTKSGKVTYATDYGIHIHETNMDALEMKERAKPEEPKPEPNPAHKFKVGDDVIVSGWGPGTVVGHHLGSAYDYIIDVDNPKKQRLFIAEDRLSPAPEPPKYYTGKVFCSGCEVGSEFAYAGLIGRVGLIQDGHATWRSCLSCENYTSFEDFCSKNASGHWHEVKE